MKLHDCFESLSFKVIFWRNKRKKTGNIPESIQFSSVQSLSRVRLFVTPWIAACQASLSLTNSWSSLKLMSIKSGMPSSHLILGRPLLLLPPIPPSISVFSSESALCMRWPKYWSFTFSIIPSKEHRGVDSKIIVTVPLCWILFAWFTYIFISSA